MLGTIPLSTYVLPEGHETGVPKFEVIQSTIDSYQTAPRVFADSQGQGLSSITWYTVIRQAVTTFRARNWSCTNGETSRNPCPSGRTWARPITSRDFFFKKNWRLAICWQISPGEQRCGLCCLFVWPDATLKVVCDGFWEFGKGARWWNQSVVCFVLFSSVFPFVFVLLWTFECCFFAVVVFCCVFCCAGSAVFVCLLVLMFGCGCVWSW